MTSAQPTVGVVMTVKNDAIGCRQTLQSLDGQTRKPDEIVVVDGGSTDETLGELRRLQAVMPQLRVVYAAGANIARGRNLGTAAASTEIIATTDAGCRVRPNWLENLVKPFAADPPADLVAGCYRIAGESLFEKVVGLCTMRGQLEAEDPRTFNPSGRSLAYRKAVWQQAGGWPEWIFFSEDTLFDHKLRRMNVRWTFAADAVVEWRPRTSVAAVARQFFNYGTGRGHTQIGAADFTYNLRNLVIVLFAIAACTITSWAIPVAVGLAVYFYVWTFHGKAVRVSQRLGCLMGYPLTIFVMWVVLFSNLMGYLFGRVQRSRDRERFERRLEAYLA